MGLKDQLRRLKRATEQNLITFELEDGTVARFGEKAFIDCFLHEHERGRRHDAGEDPGPAHPLVEALREARDLGAVMQERGTMMGHFVGEDEIMRGERERPGPPVKEVHPGRYE